MRLRRGVAFVLILSAMSVRQSAAQQAGTPTTNLKAALDEVAKKHNLRRLWFHAEQNGSVVANLGIQGASADAPEPIGSLSKSITGIAIALLIQQKKISLDTRVGDLLGPLYQRAHRPMNDNLKVVTVERLLTHTAGLPPNIIADPIHGITTDSVLKKLHAHPTAMDFIKASNADYSSGKNTFVYSNFSYLMLGLLVEAASGEDYSRFCQENIFKPLGVTPSALGGRYTATAAYDGWMLSRRDVATIWLRVFDHRNPSILSKETLDQTLFAPLGQPTGSKGDARYVMGVNVKQNADHTVYRLFHNGDQGSK